METQFSKNINDITSSVDRSNENTMRKQEQINEFVESVNISQVLDSACEGALDEIFRQLEGEGCPEEILQEVK